MANYCKKDKSKKRSKADFECKKCGRHAKKKDKLCKPKKLEHALIENE